ncbi:hypothetical protein NEHOM01_1312 [Nematocida homosporus]|uniref:uncharacterized protein n=1 Tax=Nematocida homosporus TaxID=1912981 RepID=UPI00221ED45F|nr:uncharacterized protein NEHOM01_1312 [Nematocida homosporus]KAI5186147.1 hypothetical protein NEHOM01_1312 [Nematocida homosporus]
MDLGILNKHILSNRADLVFGEEFETLCRDLIDSKVSEKSKIALAGKYFGQDKENEYLRIRELICPRTVEEISLFNNQEITANLIKFVKTQDSTCLQRAKHLSTKTDLFPMTRTLLLLAQESPAEEVLQEGYKLSRSCQHSTYLKAIVFLQARQYEQALSVIERLPKTPESLLLKIRVSTALHKPDGQTLYQEMCQLLQVREKEIAELDSCENSKARELAQIVYLKTHAERLLGQGPGIGPDAILHEIKESLAAKTSDRLASAEDLIKNNTQNGTTNLQMMQNSKKLFLSVELLRAETLLDRKRYSEAQALAQRLKKESSNENPSINERIGLVLVQTHLHLKNLAEMDTPWIVNALSARERSQKDLGLADLIELIKRKQPEPLVFAPSALVWTKKMIDLTDSSLVWRTEINKSRYWSRLGNIYFAQKRLDLAKSAYQKALQFATEDEDTQAAQENLDTLTAWANRPELPLSNFPECLALTTLLQTKCTSQSEYIERLTSTATPTEAVGHLETAIKILNTPPAAPNTALAERLTNLISICSLIKHKKPLLTTSEILNSSISVIYNHLLFWHMEQQPIDIDVVHQAIYYFLSEYSTPAQTLLAKKAIFIALSHFASHGNSLRVKEVLARTEHCLKQPEDLILIKDIQTTLNEVNPDLPSPELNNAPSVTSSCPTPSTPPTSVPLTTNTPPETLSQQTASDQSLSQKRDEIMRMLMEMQDKKPSKKPAKKKSTTEGPTPKRKKPTPTPPPEDPPTTLPPPLPQDKPQTPAPIKKKSKSVLSSDEDD